MSVYYWFTIFVLVVGGLAHYNNYRIKIMSGPSGGESAIEIKKDNENHYGIWWIILFIGFFSIQAFRYYVGADYGYYLAIDVDWSFVVEKFKTFDEPLLYLLSFIAKAIWDQPLSNMIVFSFVLTCLLFYGIKQFDENNLLASLILYMITGELLFAFNGVQQAIALMVVFAFSKKSENHWILKYLLVGFIAFLVHKSALMFLPVLFISNFKINKYQLTLLCSGAIIIPMMDQLGFDFMGVAEDANNAYLTEQINPIRAMVALAPLVLLFFVDRKKFLDKYYFVTNMTIFNAILTFSTLNSAYLNRICRYSSMYLIIFIPVCLKQMPKKSRIISSIIIFTLYFIYASYEIINSGYLYNFEWVFPFI